MLWTKETAKSYLLGLPQKEIRIATEIILAELDDAINELKNLGIDEETLNAKKYLSSLPSLPLTYTDAEKSFIDKLNAAVNVLRKNPAVWLNATDLPHEIWRDVVDYENLYKISNYGRVKSFYFTNSKILSAAFDTRKYLIVHINFNAKSKLMLLHKLVANAFLINPDNKP